MNTKLVIEQAQHAEIYFSPFSGILDLVANRVAQDYGCEEEAVKAVLRISSMAAGAFSIACNPRDFLAEFSCKYVAEAKETAEYIEKYGGDA